MSSEMKNNNAEEVAVAQCLLSMLKDSSDYNPRAQCDDPSLVSDEECYAAVDTQIEIIPNNSSSLRSYSYNNMIPANDLPNPNQWKNDMHSSVQWYVLLSRLSYTLYFRIARIICVTIFQSSEMIQVWDSTKGADNGELELLESIVPHERKELALRLFQENDYHIDYRIGGKNRFFYRVTSKLFDHITNFHTRRIGYSKACWIK